MYASHVSHFSFVTFNTMPAGLFSTGVLGTYTLGTDYSFTPLTVSPEATFTAQIICFAVNYNGNYRSYDQGTLPLAPLNSLHCTHLLALFKS